MQSYFLIVLAIYLFANGADCIIFHLLPNTQKCLTEDIQANQLVMGEYEVSIVPGQTINYIVSGMLILLTYLRGKLRLPYIYSYILGTRFKRSDSLTEGTHHQRQIQFYVRSL